VLVKAKKVTDSMILAAAKALATTVSEDEIKKGTIYPAIPKAREVTVKVVAAVMQKAMDEVC
jgi:malate dehydrogenase (oxaloacetate-decarboxylating)(NADP+)